MLAKTNRIHRIAISSVFIFAMMQIYVLHMSTYHIFKDMPPMCELCAIAKKSANGLISPAISINNSFEHIYDYKYVSIQFDEHVEFLYQSRAPPLQMFV